MDLMTGALLLLLGLAAGLAAGLLLAQSRGSVRAPDLAEREQRLLALADGRMREAEARVGGDLEARRAAVEGLVSPLQRTLDRVESQLRELERVRIGAYERLAEQVDSVRTTSEALRTETASLVTALRAPQARGRWGEMQLRRVVEIAGMVRHCDFDEQVSVTSSDGLQRPDLVVRLAGGKNVVVDAKVSLAAYLQAAETTDDDVRAERLAAHARHLRTHVDDLAAKEYWSALQPTPEFVVLFVPGEAFLAPALEHDPVLLEHAMTRRVVIATPTTLITMLRTVAYTWQQDALTENAREVFQLGQELYKRLGTLGGHLDKLGRSLTRAVDSYNGAVGSMERNVLSSARRLNALGITDRDLPALSPVDEPVRPLTAPELLESREASDARPLHAVGDE